MKVEETEWDPVIHHGRPASSSVAALRELRLNECKRIVHDDVSCAIRSCTLAGEMGRLKKKYGWKLEYYHEERGTLVVRRIA